MGYQDSFSFGTDIEKVFLDDGGYQSPVDDGGYQSPVGVQAAASILEGIGKYMQGQEEAAAYEYNANLALMQGKFKVEEIGTAEGEILATQKAMYAKAGVELSGSPLDVALNTATNYEYDKQIATFNAQSKANMYEYEAKVAKNQGQFALGMSLLQGAGGIGMGLLMA